MKLLMPMLIVFLVAFFSLTFFQGCSSQSNQNHRSSPSIGNKFGQTVVLRVGGNVYPDGYFYTTLNIGEPPKPYHLDIDTGSDLTWVQCDAPCVHCHKSPHKPYKPWNNALSCKEPLCTFLHHASNLPCHNPSDQCDYEIEYADQGSSVGVLVKDKFPLRFLNGSSAQPSLVFGCGYDQQIPSSSPPLVDGVLGLANGKSSILAQLHSLGLTRNVFGHCFSSEGGGYFFFGNEVVPSETVWVPMTKNHVGTYYSMGPAELTFGGQNLFKGGGLSLVLDSGSTYTYLSSQAYKAAVSMIKKNIVTSQLKDAPEDKTLTVCWKGAQPFKSINDAKKFFKPLALRFPKVRNAIMEIPPEAYLIVSKNGNVCLGILDGSKAQLGDLNVLGDIALLDKMVIYDTERNQIGWIPAKCDRLPKF